MCSHTRGTVTYFVFGLVSWDGGLARYFECGTEQPSLYLNNNIFTCIHCSLRHSKWSDTCVVSTARWAGGGGESDTRLLNFAAFEVKSRVPPIG